MPTESLREQSARLAEQLQSFIEQYASEIEHDDPAAVERVRTCVASLQREIVSARPDGGD